MFIFDESVAVEITDEYFGAFELELFKNEYGEPMDNINSFCHFLRWLHERGISCYLEMNPYSPKNMTKSNHKFIKRLKNKYRLIPKNIEVK